MSSNNQIILIGRVGNDVNESLRYVNGTAVAEISLAVNRPGRNRDGEQVTDWVRCQFWDRQAEVLSQYTKKGSLISVSGSLRIDSWEKEGEKRQKIFVRGVHFEFLGGRKRQTEADTSAVAA